jgi:hypothetical protein
MAGLFDAEGCVLIKNESTTVAKLTQKSSPQLLLAIMEKYGGGLSEYSVIWQAEFAATFLRLIEPYLVHKRPQVVAALKIRGFTPLLSIGGTNINDRSSILKLKTFIATQKHH